MLKTNYHTHGYQCKHAIGDEEAYILEAINSGYEVIGISDHCPFENIKSLYVRMDFERLDAYILKIENLKIKYQDQIKVLVGFESEYFEPQLEYLKSLKKRVDYLIFGNHFHTTESQKTDLINITTKEQYDLHVETAIKGMESGLFSYLAHPDIFFKYNGINELGINALDEICKRAAELDFLLEINIQGLVFQTYTTNVMFEIMQKYNNRVIIGVDAHKPSDLFSLQIKEAQLLVKKYNLRLERYIK